MYVRFRINLYVPCCGKAVLKDEMEKSLPNQTNKALFVRCHLLSGLLATKNNFRFL